MVFQRFTDRARRVMVLAQEEARALNHSYLGTEHLLLGLIHERDGVAARALELSGISLDEVRSDVGEIIGLGQTTPEPKIPFTPRAKKVLELSLREALQLGHNYIGTEHILLGLLREGKGVAAQVLERRGARLPAVRRQVLQLLGAPSEAEMPAGSEAQRPEGAEWGAEVAEDPMSWPLCPRCRAPLEETARYRVLDVSAHGEGELRAVPFAFCSKCGVWLGTIG
jgi:ATP-dependent Clp protease ATP-binding subunit ClpC